MGLDMYLHAKKYVGGWEHNRDEERAIYNRLVGEFDLTDKMDDGSPHLTIAFTVGYWRKANAIHGWFIRNVQGGEDECRPFYVSRNQLRDLRDVCAKTLAEKDKQYSHAALPPTQGFFFGSSDVDEYYFEDLEQTIAIIDRCLTIPDTFEFEYQSSW